jgi:hypothetical protein
MKKVLLVAAIAACVSGLVKAEVDVSGFASVAGGKVLSGSGIPGFVGPTFLATYPTVGVYEEEWSFKPDSKFGLQFSADLTEGLSATAQLVGRGADDFDAGFEWAYLSYELNDHWTVQAGKKRLPLYYYSDFFDVSYAYMWIRPPADNYTWQIFNYTGVNAQFNYQVSDWAVSGNIYTGSEDDGDNKLLSEYFFKQPVREIWENIIGGVLSLNRDWLDLRFTYMTYENRRFQSDKPRIWNNGTDTRRGKFMGFSANIDYNNWVLLSEVNRLNLEDQDLDTYLVSAGYRIGQWTPYVVYSDFDAEGEVHDTTSVGVRWDFHGSAAFKVQYDKVDDLFDADNPGVAGDSKAITFGIDLVF